MMPDPATLTFTATPTFDAAVAAATPSPATFRRSPYGYVPTEWICILFLVLFAISTIAHILQALLLKPRLYFLLVTAVVAGILEILGWSGRLWSSITPTAINPFLMQICCTILAPTPLVAANFVILGRVINMLGPQYSRLSPKLYTIVFCSFDLVSLVVQAIGGAKAAIAAQQYEDADPGGHIMLGGIVFQMATITIYVFFAGEFLVRFITRRPVRTVSSDSASASVVSDTPASTTDAVKVHRLSNRMKIMLYALIFNTTCLFVRSVYRTIELTDGWTGRIIATQRYFNWLDGAMIVLALYTLNFFHPSWLLYRSSTTERQIEKA